MRQRFLREIGRAPGSRRDRRPCTAFFSSCALYFARRGRTCGPAVADAADDLDDNGLVHLGRGDLADDDAAAAAALSESVSVVSGLMTSPSSSSWGRLLLAGLPSGARPGGEAAFAAAWASRPCLRRFGTVEDAAIWRRLVSSSADDVTWFVCWPRWRRNSSSRVVTSSALQLVIRLVAEAAARLQRWTCS